MIATVFVKLVVSSLKMLPAQEEEKKKPWDGMKLQEKQRHQAPVLRAQVQASHDYLVLHEKEPEKKDHTHEMMMGLYSSMLNTVMFSLMYIGMMARSTSLCVMLAKKEYTTAPWMHHAEEDHGTTCTLVIGTILKYYKMKVVDLLEESDENDTENDKIARLPWLQEVEMEDLEL
ncbi:hypothetical protein HD554DRAFT_2035093 [Boletus coccyginus]|nr:hypothetical protein HD554DRAFT_2035093 [Boletus coccyginus]